MIASASIQNEIFAKELTYLTKCVALNFENHIEQLYLQIPKFSV